MTEPNLSPPSSGEMTKIEEELMQKFGTSLENIRSLCAIQDLINKRTKEIKDKLSKKKFDNMHSNYEEYSKTTNSIPKFWIKVFCGHPKLKDWFNELDKKIFGESLNSFEIEFDNANATTYSFVFTFKENQYFSNNVLKKIYVVSSGKLQTLLDQTNVNWLENRNPAGVSNTRNKRYHRASFFQWFCKPLDHEKGGDLEAAKILLHIWTNPFNYYNVAELESAEEDKSAPAEDEDQDPTV